MLRLLALLVLLPLTAQAQAVVSAVLDATGVSDAATRRAQRATENALKAVSSLNVGEGPSFKKGAPRKCGEDCARDLVNGLDASGAVLLDTVPDPGLAESIRGRLETGGDRIADLHLWRVGPGHAAAIVSLVSDRPLPPAQYKARLGGLAGLSHVTVEVNRCEHQAAA